MRMGTLAFLDARGLRLINSDLLRVVAQVRKLLIRKMRMGALAALYDCAFRRGRSDLLCVFPQRHELRIVGMSMRALAFVNARDLETLAPICCAYSRNARRSAA